MPTSSPTPPSTTTVSPTCSPAAPARTGSRSTRTATVVPRTKQPTWPPSRPYSPRTSTGLTAESSRWLPQEERKRYKLCLCALFAIADQLTEVSPELFNRHQLFNTPPEQCSIAQATSTLALATNRTPQKIRSQTCETVCVSFGGSISNRQSPKSPTVACFCLW